ncbi:hypothetical protein [Dongia sp.]|jgi:hypothetical protein|uniref:hypothetical protein n=1 Tax=Dongia sp. TaxID=1977262 RepID=UPI0035B23850
MTANEPSLHTAARPAIDPAIDDEGEAGAAGNMPAAKTPIVTKLTTPLGKAQRNNWLVMALLGLDVVLGATFGLVGHFGLESSSISLAGAVMATIGLVLMVCFQLFGREK